MSMANLSQLSYTRSNNNANVSHNHIRAVWLLQDSCPVGFSAHLF